MKIKISLAVLLGLVAAGVASAQTTDLTNTPAPEEAPKKPAEKLNKVVIDYERDEFNGGFSPWDLGYISLGHQFDWGSAIARYNRARRFDENGEQWEADLYPHLRDGTYMYLNYGRSNSANFPDQRYGAEIFQSLGLGWEGSIGFRKLEFTSGGVTLWTGSIAKYVGDWYIYVRPYHTPSNIGASNSWTFGARYYLDDEQYIAAAVGSGLSVQQDFSLAVIGLQSQKAGVDAYLSVGQDTWVHPGIGFRKDEIRTGIFREMWSYDLSIEKRF